MITSTAWRFAWKEYRNLRGFWIVLIVVTILIQLLLVLNSSLRDPAALNAEEDYFLVLAITWLITCFYAFGCGAILFAHEHDESTFELLRGMPIFWKGMLLGKSAAAAASTLLLSVIVTLTGTLLALRVLGSSITDAASPPPAFVAGIGFMIFTEACRVPPLNGISRKSARPTIQFLEPLPPP